MMPCEGCPAVLVHVSIPGANMRSRIVAALFLISFSVTAGFAQELNMMSKFTSGEPVYHVKRSEIPFRLLRHKITVPVFVNEEPNQYVFVLDTGALTFIAEDVAAALELEIGQSVPTIDEDEKAYLTRLESKNLIIPRMDFQTVFDSTFVFAGFIGSDFLRFFRVGIDYEDQRLILSQPSDTMVLTQGQYRIPMEIPLPMRFPFVDIMVNDSVKTRAMIDTGSPFAFVMPLSFEKTLCGSTTTPCLKSTGTLVKWPSTDPPHNCLTRLSTLCLGDMVIRNLPVLLTDLPMMVGTPLLGRDFLDRYRIELDYPSEQLFLSPVEGRDHENNVYSAGIGLKERDGTVIVSGFWEGSPAASSGLEPGARVFELNGMDAGSLTQDDIDALLNDDAIPSIQLGVQRDDGFRMISLHKVLLFPAVEQPLPDPMSEEHE
jgi:hypothetical protein